MNSKLNTQSVDALTSVSTLRLAKSLSREELSYKCVLPTSQIGRFERGERSPALNTIRILAEGLGEEPSKLLEFKYNVNNRE